MPVYTYKVRDKSGRILQGQMEAADDRDLRKRLDEQDFFIIEYEQHKSTKDFLSMNVFPASRQVRLIDISAFSWQLFTMLDAGLTLVYSLKTLINQTKNESFKKVLANVCQRVEEGAPFSEALKAHPQVFSVLFVQMVNAGEVGGVLDEMMRRLAVYYERQAELQSKMNSALIYPVLLFVLSIGVVIFLVTFVLPQFAKIFNDIGARIPPTTQMLLDLSVFLKSYWMVMVGLVAAALVLLRLYIATEQGKYQWDLIVINIPLVGTLVRKNITTQFTQTLAILVAGGIPILTALDVCTDTIHNKIVVKTLKKVAVSVGEGKTIAQPLEDSRIFPEMVVNMIKVGEESGSLEKMLEKVSEFYTREVTNAVESFTKMVEPVLMVLMAGIIGFVALSIFMPLADLIRNVRG